MSTYCLITMLRDDPVGWEPIPVQSESHAIAYVSGVLSERLSQVAGEVAVKGTHYVLERGSRDVADPKLPSPGGVVGGWAFDLSETAFRLVFKPARSA